MNNLGVAAALYEIADLLELKGAEVFKIRAYRKAAEAISLLADEVAEQARRRQLTRVPGIGRAIGAKVEELLTTGQIAYLEELRRAIPPGVRDLTRVPGLGAKTAMTLYTRLGIDSLERLEMACRQGEVRDLPGLGIRKEAAILAALERVRAYGQRISIGAVKPVAEALVAHLRQHPAVAAAEVAGAIRRRRETVDDIDIAVATADPAGVIAYLKGLPLAGEVLLESADRLTMTTSLGRRIDLVTAPPDQFGRALLMMTGPQAHLDRLGVLPVAGSESEVYAGIGLPFIEPELREGGDEVEAARSGSLPTLVTIEDLKGDLHSHTLASDGTAPLAEMAEAARALGHQYLAICDHSRSLAIAGGLSPERLLEQMEEIRRLNRRWSDFRLLAGTEVDILKDGSLDFPDAILAQLDLVVASIHSHMHLDEAAQTERLLKAIANPHVDIIGHPFGRVIGRREPYALDFARVLEACAASGTALEISASPARLDLSDHHARLAKERGIKLAVNTDAHSVHELKLLEYGVDQARRAWLEREDLLNALTLTELMDWLDRRR